MVLNPNVSRMALLVCMAVALLACDVTALLPGASGTPQPGPTQAAQAGTLVPTQSASVQAPPPTGAEPTKGGASPTPGAGRDTPFGRVADPSELTSYRARMLMEFRKSDGSKPESMKMSTEWVKSPPSLHTSLGEGNQAIEVVKIGDRSWVKMGANWIESPAEQQNAAANTRDSYLPEQNVQVKALGDDTVNGVRCRRQSYSGQVTVVIPSIQNRPESRVTFDVTGEMCIANQAGLAPVVVREKSEIAGNLFGALFQAVQGTSTKTTAGESTYVERELYDINAAIAINPPQASTALAGLPTPPGGTRTTPTVRSSPAAKTPAVKASPSVKATTATTVKATATRQSTVAPAGTALFTDPFTGSALNGKWSWQDRWDDAQYDLKARPGFLRMIVPTGNDLSPWTNFDGPYLLQPVDGDWSAVTAVEFVPVQQFQGAGLLVYVDDDNLVRLERAAGGIGLENGVHLSVIREGEFEMVAAVEQPSATVKKIELRLERAGNRFTAWWREPGASWQSVGAAEFEVPGTVQVGIAALCEFDAPEVTADFDSMTITRPR